MGEIAHSYPDSAGSLLLSPPLPSPFLLLLLENKMTQMTQYHMDYFLNPAHDLQQYLLTVPLFGLPRVGGFDCLCLPSCFLPFSPFVIPYTLCCVCDRFCKRANLIRAGFLSEAPKVLDWTSLRIHSGISILSMKNALSRTKTSSLFWVA